jgi:hypothetical protein
MLFSAIANNGNVTHIIVDIQHKSKRFFNTDRCRFKNAKFKVKEDARSRGKHLLQEKRCWICQPPIKLKTTMDLAMFSFSKTFKLYINNYVYVNQQHPSFDLRRQMSLADKGRRARENK